MEYKKDCFAYSIKKDKFTNKKYFYCKALNVTNCLKCSFYKNKKQLKIL